jgi:hypothetical protein
MSIADELKKLAEMHAGGTLTDEEFQQAKKKLLATPEETPDETPRAPRSGLPRSFPLESGNDDSVGKAANRYVTLQMVMAVIGILILLLFFAPMMCSHSRPGFGPSTPSFGP